MNKNEMAVQMVKDSSISKNDALKVIDLIVEIAGSELKKRDGKLILVGFGTFKTVTRKKTTGRNPRTGEQIVVPKRRVVKFIPGKKLKELIK